jgi:hypothetical protein
MNLDTIKNNLRNHHWPTVIGWACFWLLLIATATGNYIFDPFVFGFSYYAIYLLTQIGKLEKAEEAGNNSQRILILSVISLVYMWFHLNSNIDKRKFEREFEKTCWGARGLASQSQGASKVCDEIQGIISTHLAPEPDDT